MNEDAAVMPPPVAGAVPYPLKIDVLMQSFIGEKYQLYYQKKFAQISAKKLMYGFNIGAFLFSVIWLYYRKMYFYGTAAALLLLGLLVLESVFNFRGHGIGLVFALSTGFMGNSLYKDFAERKIAALMRRNIPQLQHAVEQAGGTNLGLALVLLTLLFVISFVRTLM